MSHDLAILARARLAFVRVNDEVLGAEGQHIMTVSSRCRCCRHHTTRPNRALSAAGGRVQVAASTRSYRPSPGLFMKLHFNPDGNPAPPRPRRLRTRDITATVLLNRSHTVSNTPPPRRGPCGACVPRVLDFLQNPLVALIEDFSGLVPASPLHVSLETPVVLA